MAYQPILNPLPVTGTNYATTDRGGTTSGTANTYTQVMASNSSRKKWFIQNPSTNTNNLIVARGASTSETVFCELYPGDSVGERFPDMVTSDRIAIKCVGAVSQNYYAHEA